MHLEMILIDFQDEFMVMISIIAIIRRVKIEYPIIYGRDIVGLQGDTQHLLNYFHILERGRLLSALVSFHRH